VNVYLPVQVTPFPAYPVLQVQVKFPSALVQVACVSQPPLFVAHSSISAAIYGVLAGLYGHNDILSKY